MTQYYFSHTKPHGDVEYPAIKTGCIKDCKYLSLETIRKKNKCSVCWCEYYVTHHLINCAKEKDYNEWKNTIINYATQELNSLFDKNWKYANYLYKKIMLDRFYEVTCPFYNKGFDKCQ